MAEPNFVRTTRDDERAKTLFNGNYEDYLQMIMWQGIEPEIPLEQITGDACNMFHEPRGYASIIPRTRHPFAYSIDWDPLR